jgi:cation diffusion facilitator family transporter
VTQDSESPIPAPTPAAEPQKNGADPGGRAERAMRTSLLAIVVSVVLAVGKLAAGVIGHSFALIADGVESMLDVVSASVVWGGLRIAATPPDEKHPYGHGKAESMAALVVAVILLSAAVFLAIQSVAEILAPRQAPAPFTLVVLVVVVITKELLFARMSRVGKSVDSTSLRADAWHHRSDSLTSAAAFVGISLSLILGEGYESLDAWAALVACGIISFNGIRILRVAMSEAMDRAAPQEVLERIRRLAASVPGVVGVDKCLSRKSGPYWLVDIHVLVDPDLPVSEGHEIGHDVKRALRESELGVLDVLVHVEPADEAHLGKLRLNHPLSPRNR